MSRAIFMAGLALAAGCRGAAPLDDIARSSAATSEETHRLRQERLRALFDEHARGAVTAEAVRDFNRRVRDAGMTTFDDFLRAMTSPVRQVVDPASGDTVPVFGHLGSDVVNPWLAAVGVVEGSPMKDQPMVALAADVLREHVDFALIGVRDPGLSFESIPPVLRERAREAYARLNPTGEFDGGFDHALFYAVVREAARMLFREDYPRAKPTIADLVVPEEQGGYGIASCLLCHENNPAGVYGRLLGQSLLHETMAAQLRAEGAAAAEVEADAAVFARAAARVLEAFPDAVDPAAVRRSLSAMSEENVERLKPGYDDFVLTLRGLGCLRCHSTDCRETPQLSPAAFDAFVLNPNGYYKGRNIVALLSVIDFEDLDRSPLLEKAARRIDHVGGKKLELDPAQVEELRAALVRWVTAFSQ